MLSRRVSAIGQRVALRGSIASPLYRSSLYLMAGPVASAGLGFLFWLIAARVTDAAAIGVAAAALASVNLLITLSELGLATVLIHYAPRESNPATALVNTSIRLGWLAIVAASVLFLLGLQVWSPGLLAVRDSLALGLLFMAYASFNHVLAIQDAAMISHGVPAYVFARTLACNIPSVILLIPLVAVVGDLYGLFAAYTLPNVAVGIIVGLLVLPRYFPRYHFLGALHREVVTRIASYGLTNHAGNVLWAIPLYILPIIAVNTLPADETGRFYIVWAIANLVLIAPRMITYALFAESSRSVLSLRTFSIRSAIAIAVATAPAALILWLEGRLVLGFFGTEYIDESVLQLLLLSVIPFSINSIWFVVLRVRRRLREIVLFSGLATVSIVLVAGALVHEMGADGLAAGWLVGHGIAAFIALFRATQAIWRGAVWGWITAHYRG